jgi:hypothetical protein
MGEGGMAVPGACWLAGRQLPRCCAGCARAASTSRCTAGHVLLGAMDACGACHDMWLPTVTTHHTVLDARKRAVGQATC